MSLLLKKMLGFAPEITKCVFLGDMYTAKNKAFFELHDIKTVINATPDVPNYFENDVKYIRVPVHDSMKEKDLELMAKCLPDLVKFLKHETDKNEPVLIHCVAGRQRSAIIVAVFLCTKFNISLNDAYKLLLSIKPDVFNYGNNMNFYLSAKYFLDDNHL